MFRFSFSAPGLAAVETLKVGSPAPRVKVAQFVKGGPNNMVKSGATYKIKPGTVHVVEFWATWCGPCRQTIPHLTQPAAKYKGKVTMTGVSISERGATYVNDVQRFVAMMGDQMNYNVAVDDKAQGGYMALNWMDAAGQDGIPTAFIVGRDGKIAFVGHPMTMEEPLARIVAGKRVAGGRTDVPALTCDRKSG